MTNLENKTKRYRYDATYRQRQIADVTSRHNQRLSDPTYKRLSYLRKKICEVRDSIEAHLIKTAKRERQLIRLIVERDQLAARLKG
jgi:hypothetical protein